MSSSAPETVPFVDLVAQYQRHREEIDAAIRETIEKTSFIGGPALGRFEKAFAAYCGVRHAVGCANGTDALYLILRSLGLAAGDEVILPANSFIATAEAVSQTGATPIFVDVTDHDHLINPEAVAAAVTAKTRAVMPVHLFGQLVPMAPIEAIAKKHDLLIVEDSAQAHGAEENGRRAGSYGRATGFSFYPGKNLGAYGDAGAVVTDDSTLAERVRRLANHGRAEKFGHDLVGVNSRLDGLQAAILEVKLRHLETWTNERRAAAKRYDTLLADIPGVRLPQVRTPLGHVFHLYVIRVKARDALKAFLTERHIQVGIHYPHPLHLTGAYAPLGYQKGSMPVAEAQAEEILSLPMSPEITLAQQERVAAAVREFQVHELKKHQSAA